MKIYFINPNENSLILYCMDYPDDTDINSMIRLRIGYNDSYEMRSQYVGWGYFSTNPEKLEIKLKERRNNLIKKEYKRLIEVLKYKTGDRNNVMEHCSIDAPF